MTTLKFTTVDQHLVLQRQPMVASGDKNSVLIQIQLCSMWDGFDVKVAFYKDGNRDFVLDIPLEDGACMVPPEMLDTPCVLNIGIWGKDARGRYKTSTMVKYRVAEGTPIEAGVTLVDVRDGTAEEDQVLAGATFYAGDSEKKTGNIPTFEEGELFGVLIDGEAIRKIEEQIKPVKTVNGVAPDETGNVKVSGGVETDFSTDEEVNDILNKIFGV